MRDLQEEEGSAVGQAVAERGGGGGGGGREREGEAD